MVDRTLSGQWEEIFAFCVPCVPPSPPFMGSVSFLYNEAAQSLGPISASASGVHNGNCQHLGFGEKRGW